MAKTGNACRQQQEIFIKLIESRLPTTDEALNKKQPLSIGIVTQYSFCLYLTMPLWLEWASLW
jgi:hypothetical protein